MQYTVTYHSWFVLSVFAAATSFTAEATSDTTVGLTWIKPEEGGEVNNVANYNLTWTSDIDNDSVSIPNDVNTVTLENLSSNTFFMITMFAVGDDGRNGVESGTTAVTCK